MVSMLTDVVTFLHCTTLLTLLVLTSSAVAESIGFGWLPSARCHAKCLHIFERASMLASSDVTADSVDDSNDTAPSRTASTSLLTKCHKDLVCSSCYSPCSWDLKEIKGCVTRCQETKFSEPCVQSCLFLDEITKTAKINPKKLCAEAAEEGLITNLQVSEVGTPRGLRLKWSVSCPSTSPLLFLVQVRQLSHRELPHDATDWHVISTTSDPQDILRVSLAAERWHQLRVVAVTSEGIVGISRVTEAIRAPKDPEVSPPGPPRDLEDKGKESGVSMSTIVWKSPESDLPVDHYRIRSWRCRTAQCEHPVRIPDNPDDVTEWKLPGRKHSLKIKNLLYNSQYVVQIQAISKLNDLVLEGMPATLIIQTFKTLNFDATSTMKQESTVTEHFLIPMPVDSLLFFQEPFYEGKHLKATISWRYPQEMLPNIHRFVVEWHVERCASRHQQKAHEHNQQASVSPKENSFQLYGLQFECIYQVDVRAVSVHGFYGDGEQLAFITPPCYNVSVIDKRAPLCPSIEPSRLLCVDTMENRDEVSIHCNWQMPFPAVPAETIPKVKGFQVVVKSRSETSSNTARNDEVVIETTKDDTQATVHGLKLNEVYLVKVRAMGIDGYGPAATLTVTTYPRSNRQGRYDQHQYQMRQHLTSSAISLKVTSYSNVLRCVAIIYVLGLLARLNVYD